MTVGKVCTSKFNPRRIKMGFCCNKKSKSWQRGYPNRKFCSKKTLNKSRKSRKSQKRKWLKRKINWNKKCGPIFGKSSRVSVPKSYPKMLPIDLDYECKSRGF